MIAFIKAIIAEFSNAEDFDFFERIMIRMRFFKIVFISCNKICIAFFVEFHRNAFRIDRT